MSRIRAALSLSLVFLLAPAGSWAAADPPPCLSKDLVIADPRLYGLGDSLHLIASGGCAARIEQQLQKVAPGQVAVLHLDGVAMTGLVLSPQGLPEAFDLGFRISRDSQQDLGRKAWDALLERQNMGYPMHLSAALAIGSELPVRVSGESLRFTTVRGGATLVGVVVVVGVLLLLGTFSLLMRGNALRDGWGGAFSLGKSQMAFWGLLVFFTFAGILILTGSMERIPPQTLALLGISGVTGLAAVLIGNSKDSTADAMAKLELERIDLAARLASGQITAAERTRALEVQRTLVALNTYKNQPHTSFGDFCRDICDDGSGVSFHRVQVVMWTLLLGAVFVWTVTEVISMPEFPETLLLLLGISNGTYLGFKFPEKV